MRTFATVSSILAVMLLLLPWQICTCSEDGAHLKSLWSQAECPSHDAPLDGSREGEDHEHGECDQLFSFAGAEGDVDLDLPDADEGRTLLLSAGVLPVIDWERPPQVAGPGAEAREAVTPAVPLQMRTRLLL